MLQAVLTRGDLRRGSPGAWPGQRAGHSWGSNRFPGGGGHHHTAPSFCSDSSDLNVPLGRIPSMVVRRLLKSGRRRVVPLARIDRPLSRPA